MEAEGQKDGWKYLGENNINFLFCRNEVLAGCMVSSNEAAPPPRHAHEASPSPFHPLSTCKLVALGAAKDERMMKTDGAIRNCEEHRRMELGKGAARAAVRFKMDHRHKRS